MSATIIRGGRLLDIAAHRADPADILIEGDTIREVGAPGMPAPAGARTVDGRDRLLMPGLINAHTHGHGALSRGVVPDQVPLERLLVSGPSIAGHRSVEDKYLAAQLSAIELVRRGCTACYDLYAEYPLPTVEGIEAAARAYADVGIRAVVAPMMADRTLYQALPGLMEALPDRARREVESLRAAPYQACVDACRQILKSWPLDRERVAPALGPTIPLHCSDDFLQACATLAREFDVPIQTHLAESKNQATLGVQRYGTTLAAHLADLGVVGPRFSGAHGVWLTRDDVHRLADLGASVAHNPLSNLRLGSGIAPVRMMLDAGLRVGVGTDSAASSDTQNMFECTRLAAYVSRVRTFDYRRWLTVEEALTMATEGSAGVLGLPGRHGRLAPGCKADVVFLDLGNVNYVPLSNVTLQIVNGESGLAVDRVMIGGRMVLEGGRLLTVDEARVRARAEAAIVRLREATGAAVAAARALEPFVGSFCLTQARVPYDLGDGGA
jgi:5-methylthioadenosine/S-adenosylhomocysteine deaminase